MVGFLNLRIALNLAKGFYDTNPVGHLSHACMADNEAWKHVRAAVCLGSKSSSSKNRAFLSPFLPCSCTRGSIPILLPLSLTLFILG